MEKKVYQPLIYTDDGTNIDWRLPAGMSSSNAFASQQECIDWMTEQGYAEDEYIVKEYDSTDIEDYTLM